MDVFVDVENDDGPWIVIQRRTSGDDDFYRDWDDYKNGFGDLLGNFWIGNDKLHLLTRSMNILRVELETWDGLKGYAQYSTFKVADERYNYKLTVTGFTGNVTYDAMDFHNGYDFTTRDRDHDVRGDVNCATRNYGGWWYRDCHTCNLNGLYKKDNGANDAKAMVWNAFPSRFTPLKKSKMMIQ
ncbi:ryncolin-1-like [Argopecten irradians]|uniref:ryncolin-1-like n=1 Tax=Argopecten irradians TaxID=31199 RepID=UPI003718FA21